MSELLKKLSTNQRLALLALVLGFGALFGGQKSDAKVEVDLRDMAIAIDKKTDHVSATDLADWIIEGKIIRLIDVREAEAFAEYHIPGAESCQLAGLLDYPIERNEEIVLYSGGGYHAFQAWSLLKAKDYKAVYVLFDGLNGWKDEVLFPAASAETTAEARAAFAKAVTVSKQFGGKPRTESGDAGETSPVIMPKVEAPTGLMPAGGAKPKKKRREGC